MDFKKTYKEKIFRVNQGNFNEYALELFNYQAINNEVYRHYIELLRVNPSKVQHVTDIPFLPIGFFKTHTVSTGQQNSDNVFYSSGTTGMSASKHYVSDLGLYEKISEYIFNQFYGPLNEYIFIALLPSYQENKNSSLIFMINSFMRKSGSAHSVFISQNFEQLQMLLKLMRKEKKKIVLFAVTYALLELAENAPMDLSDVIIIETGGMKGRREEMTRFHLHNILKKAFKLQHIHSEYGMTELLSQAYSAQNGIFTSPAWMKILVREVNDPFSYVSEDLKTGGINIIDLANIDSCAFIETQDLGRTIHSKSFEILGRFDNSELRGCNLLYFS
jgi:phenylacetate-coenzyme A ligase PaaK-like adenylate-forming protein